MIKSLLTITLMLFTMIAITLFFLLLYSKVSLFLRKKRLSKSLKKYPLNKNDIITYDNKGFPSCIINPDTKEIFFL